MINYKQQLKNINALIFDVDGVLTNGSLILSPDGELLRVMNVKDGFAIHQAVKKGIEIAIITGGQSMLVKKRFEDLGVKDIFIGVHDKLDVFNQYMKIKGLMPDEILYMGDDIPDIEVLKKVAIATCPSDSVEEVKAVVHYISPFKGGEGCVRDVIEQVMKVKNLWFDKDALVW